MPAIVPLVASCLALGLPSPCPPAPDDPLPSADAAITRAELEHHVRFLASDELEGRGQASEGLDRAASYLVRSLEAAGFEPAGEGGTFFQATGVRRIVFTGIPRLLLTRESGEVHEAVYGRDFTLAVRGSAHSTEVLPLRFFYDYNHFRMPREGNPAEAIHFSAGRKTREKIFERLRIENLEDWGLEVKVNLGQGGLETGAKAERVPDRLVTDLAGGCEAVVLRGPLRKEFERRAFTHMQLLAEEQTLPYLDRNILARLPGAGTPERPELAEEVVLLTANYDHVGIRPPRPRGSPREDWVFNGANDNASGCAALLELAQALAAGARPARTLLFLFTTGSEGKDEGLERYLAQPSAPLARTVVALNLDALGKIDPDVGGSGRLWLSGAERSNLLPAWEEAELGIVVDPQPREGRYQRSKFYDLALEGIVTHTLSSRLSGKNRPVFNDEAGGLDYAHLEAATHQVLRAVQPLADGSLQPEWKRGKRPRTLAQRDMPKRKTAEERQAEGDERRKKRRARRAEEEAGGDDNDNDNGDDNDDD
jgi:aminopeptidase YwaD